MECPNMHCTHEPSCLANCRLLHVSARYHQIIAQSVVPVASTLIALSERLLFLASSAQ